MMIEILFINATHRDVDDTGNNWEEYLVQSNHIPPPGSLVTLDDDSVPSIYRVSKDETRHVYMYGIDTLKVSIVLDEIIG